MARGKKKSVEWGERHRSAALRRLYEIAGEAAETMGDGCAASIAESVQWSAASERHFRDGLAEADLTPTEIAKEVHLIRARAEGRVVEERSIRWEVRWNRGAVVNYGTSEATAREVARSNPGAATVVRVTTLRRRIMRPVPALPALPAGWAVKSATGSLISGWCDHQNFFTDNPARAMRWPSKRAAAQGVDDKWGPGWRRYFAQHGSPITFIHVPATPGA